jgi:hypothetical protein
MHCRIEEEKKLVLLECQRYITRVRKYIVDMSAINQYISGYSLDFLTGFIGILNKRMIHYKSIIDSFGKKFEKSIHVFAENRLLPVEKNWVYLSSSESDNEESYNTTVSTCSSRSHDYSDISVLSDNEI